MNYQQEQQEKTRYAFQDAFSGEKGERVLRVISDFCAENEHGFIEDVQKSYYVQGRQSVIAEIRNILKEGK